MSLSRLMSLVESIANVVVGYCVAVVTQIAVFPFFGIEATLDEHLAIGLAFVGVSLARGSGRPRGRRPCATGGVCPQRCSVLRWSSW